MYATISQILTPPLPTVSLPLFSSFEYVCVRLTTASTSFTLLIIYRPPSTNSTLFQAEFSPLLEDSISYPSELVITGDFNLHVDDPNSPACSYKYKCL